MPQRHEYVQVGEVKLHVVIEGEGPPVVLLHGFPEHWYSWRRQLKALSEAGFQAIAPDLRGYNLSDKPKGVANYTLAKLEGDVAGLIRALGHSRAHVVGHDWGGALAWSFAARQAALVERLVILNAPHPLRFLKAATSLAQLRRSWYMFAFQLPWLPERATRRTGFMKQAMRGWAVNKDHFPDEELARFTEAYHQPGAATAAINWYRAALRDPREAVRGIGRINAPTLILWGEQDRALGLELLDGLDEYVSNLRIVRIPNASHWVQQDAPEVVNRELVAFLKGP